MCLKKCTDDGYDTDFIAIDDQVREAATRGVLQKR